MVYNQCHMYVGEPGAPDSPSAIQHARRYLLEFDRLRQTAASDEELFNRMTEPAGQPSSRG
jgi:hypothetical protein